MEFQKSVIKVIEQRKSCRSYGSKEIDKITLQKLMDYMIEISKETKTKARFIYSNSDKTNNEASGKLGTYGMITGASSYIIGIVDKNDINEVEFGYLFEKIVLFATDLGLQTCWLGGTFDRNAFNHISNLLENELIAIVSPVGFKKEKPRIIETAMRAVIGANKRKLWSEMFFEENVLVPLIEDSADKYKVMLEMVRLAPSASNKQPWRIIKDKNDYNFFLCRTKNYPMINFDMQKNDIGIAKCHFELTAKELGLNGEWNIIDNVSVPNEWEYITTWSVSI